MGPLLDKEIFENSKLCWHTANFSARTQISEILTSIGVFAFNILPISTAIELK